MKRVILLITLLIISGLCFAQTSVTTLDRALNDAVVYFESRLQSGAKVIILNMNTSQTGLSDYIIDELAAYMVNNNKLTVIDRRNLESIRREMNFQMSGDVSDETAQSIGRILGAQYIISGTLVSLGDLHRLRVQALAVETAQIAGMINLNVPSSDRVIMALSRERAPGESSSRATAQISTTLPAAYDTGMKPEKKIPARRGNFEIIPGNQIRQPIDTNKFYTAAKTSLENLRYTVDAEGTGFILFTISGGDWWAQIKLCYWNDEYWFEYISSHNLDANPARDKIHKNYAEWIKRIERQLNTNYGGGGTTARTSTTLPVVYDIGMKPEKKIPERKGNFEIIPGKQIRRPIDTNKFYTAAKTSLDNLRYTVDEEGTGFVLFTVRGSNWWCQIKLCYWNDEYWYEYVNSHNLGANPARNKIHDNYVEWIKRVEKQLNANYR
jgi:hypothetical protein